MSKYSEKDVQFLKALKAKGVPAEEAFKRLNAVKAKISGNPVTNIAKIAANPLSPDNLTNLASGAKKIVDAMPTPTDEQVTQYRSEFAADNASRDQRAADVMALNKKGITPNSSYSDAQVSQQLANASPDALTQAGRFAMENMPVLGGVTQVTDMVTGAANKALPPDQQVGRVADLGAGALKGAASTGLGAMELGARIVGQGDAANAIEGFNVEQTSASNPMQEAGRTAEQIGEFFVPAGAIAKGVKAGNVLTKGGKLGNMAIKAGLEGLAAGGVTALQKGEIDQDVATNAMLGGAFSVGGDVLGAAKNLFSKAPANIKNEALRLGLHEKYANALEGLDDVQKAKGIEYLQTGINKLNDPINAPGVFDVAGKEVEDFLTQAKTFQKQLGQKVGAAKEKFTNIKVDIEPLKASLKKTFESVGVKNLKDLKSSDIGKNTQVMSMIQDLDKLIKTESKVYGTVNARKLESFTSQIDEITGLLKTSGLQKSKANTVLTNLKSAINESLAKASPEFGKVNTEYAKLMKDLKKVENATRVTLGNGDTIANGAGLLRKSLGNADKKYNSAIKSMQRLSDTFGIPMPKDLKMKAFLADLAEKYTGTTAPQSLGGAAETAFNAALDNAPGKIPGVIRFARDVKNQLLPTPEIQNQVEKVIKALNKSIETGKEIKIKPKDAVKLTQILSGLIKGGTMEAVVKN